MINIKESRKLNFVSRLASCYRYILDNREEDLVSLEKELSFLDSFIFMMNVRHEGALEIKTEVLLESSEYVIPTLTLQMLVENALKHNYYSKERPLEILVKSKGTQRLVVQNTFRKRELEEESTGLGIKNIEKRYAFYTRQEVLVEQSEDLFTVEIPLLPKNMKEVKMINVS
ncbi:MAG: histidine kinase [Bacteroidota bacterium]